MTGAAGYGLVLGLRVGVVDLRHEFRVDFLRHGDHGASAGLLWLRVGGEVRLVGLLIYFVAEVAVHAESSRIAAHQFHQVPGRYVCREHLEICGLRHGHVRLWSRSLGIGGCVLSE